jgi:hypothetical protein
MMINRRSFICSTAGAGALAALGDLAFLGRLRPVSAAEAQLDPKMVRLHPDIEPLVRLIEESPRDRVLEEVAGKIKSGVSYREILAALLLAGVRNVQPRPVGFKFHAVLVVNSAHLASLASSDHDRWLPIFWALDYFKRSQAADVNEGDWSMPPVDENAVPPSHRAREAFITAMDDWDEAAADAAVVGLARTAGANEIFEIFCRYGVRDFRDIGHKAIYVANSFRTLEAIGWHHAEPVLRSLAYGLLDRSGAKESPAKLDLPADRPFRRNLKEVQTIKPGWLDGKPNPAEADELLKVVRTGGPNETSDLAIELLNRGVSAQSIFDSLQSAAGELLMRAPGILSLHASTYSNAVRYAFNHAHAEETRRLLLVQTAAFLPLFRGKRGDEGPRIDELEPLTPTATGEAAVQEVFEQIGSDRLAAARKAFSYLRNGGDPEPFADAARRMIFLKGRDSHDYKFSSAVLEDYAQMQPAVRDRFLAASVFYFRGSGDRDNEVVARTRAAIA